MNKKKNGEKIAGCIQTQEVQFHRNRDKSHQHGRIHAHNPINMEEYTHIIPSTWKNTCKKSHQHGRMHAQYPINMEEYMQKNPINMEEYTHTIRQKKKIREKKNKPLAINRDDIKKQRNVRWEGRAFKLASCI